MDSSIHTRKQGCFSVFDVSHMLQLTVKGAKSNEFFEAATVVDCKELGHGSVKLSLLTNSNGGIIDDCMVARKSDNEFRLVVNAGCADKDLKHLQALAASPQFKGSVDVIPIYDRALVAAQGPAAAAAVEKLSGKSLKNIPFMHMIEGKIAGADVIMTRCGYTGEDGFKISIPRAAADAVADALMQCSGASRLETYFVSKTVFVFTATTLAWERHPCRLRSCGPSANGADNSAASPARN
jgi:aminomethyltransferase